MLSLKYQRNDGPRRESEGRVANVDAKGRQNMSVIQFTLTVSEGKWLIALGIGSLPQVREALREHSVLLKGGTTVSCVSEVLLGAPMRISGRISRRGAVTSKTLSKAPHALLARGGKVENIDKDPGEAAAGLGPGDVVITGANIFDACGNAAMLAGTIGGGSFGKILPVIATEGCEVIIAAGLEKFAPGNVNDAVIASRRKGVDSSRGMACGLIPINGRIFTELDAIKALADVDAVLIGRGGIDGAEGACVFQAEGEEAEIEKLRAALEKCRGRGVSGDPESLEECGFPCVNCGRHLSCCYKYGGR